MATFERWYFTKEQLANTPSRKCGTDADKELSYRQQAANFIQDMGQRLQVTQLCINTAIVYMHRFYMFHSFKKFHRNSISSCALFLAAKLEEQPRKLEHVIKVAYMCLNREGPPLDVKSEKYLELSQDLVINENILLQSLGFDVAIDHPHTHVVKCCQMVKASKDLAQTSYFMATNSLHLTVMCLQYKPTIVACVCIHLACKWANWEIPKSSEGKDWFSYVEKTVTMELLEELTNEFLCILDKCPSRLKKKIMAASRQEKLEGSLSERGRELHHLAFSANVTPSPPSQSCTSPTYKPMTSPPLREDIMDASSIGESSSPPSRPSSAQPTQPSSLHWSSKDKKSQWNSLLEPSSNPETSSTLAVPSSHGSQNKHSSPIKPQQLPGAGPSVTSPQYSKKPKHEGQRAMTAHEYKEMKERKERERVERERQEKMRIEKERHEKMKLDKIEREKQERDKLEKKRMEEMARRKEKERQERAKLERERIEKEKTRKIQEAERAEKERLEKERSLKIEQERIERERLEKERIEQEREKRERELFEKERIRKLQELQRAEKERERKEKERMEREKQIERARLEKERMERLERERIEKERLERERIEKERIERMERERIERLERERLEKERIERERIERLERERLERLERERLERERIERERVERMERERLERERIERERIEKERVERERLERERLEKERIERERIEKERIERERLERLEKERREKERLERLEKERLERLEKERLERLERERLERLERERLERERVEKERQERLKLEKEKLEKERLEKLEKQRLERIEKERLERLEKERMEKLEKERLEKEKLEKERLQRLEFERLEKERLEKEKQVREHIERERLRKIQEAEKEKELLDRKNKELERLEKLEKEHLVALNPVKQDVGRQEQETNFIKTEKIVHQTIIKDELQENDKPQEESGKYKTMLGSMGDVRVSLERLDLQKLNSEQQIRPQDNAPRSKRNSESDNTSVTGSSIPNQSSKQHKSPKKLEIKSELNRHGVKMETKQETETPSQSDVVSPIDKVKSSKSNKSRKSSRHEKTTDLDHHENGVTKVILGVGPTVVDSDKLIHRLAPADTIIHSGREDKIFPATVKIKIGDKISSEKSSSSHHKSGKHKRNKHEKHSRHEKKHKHKDKNRDKDKERSKDKYKSHASPSGTGIKLLIPKDKIGLSTKDTVQPPKENSGSLKMRFILPPRTPGSDSSSPKEGVKIVMGSTDSRKRERDSKMMPGPPPAKISRGESRSHHKKPDVNKPSVNTILESPNSRSNYVTPTSKINSTPQGTPMVPFPFAQPHYNPYLYQQVTPPPPPPYFNQKGSHPPPPPPLPCGPPPSIPPPPPPDV